MGIVEGWWVLFLLPFFFFFVPLVGPSCISGVYLWAFLGFFFDEYISCFTRK